MVDLKRRKFNYCKYSICKLIIIMDLLLQRRNDLVHFYRRKNTLNMTSVLLVVFLLPLSSSMAMVFKLQHTGVGEVK